MTLRNCKTCSRHPMRDQHVVDPSINHYIILFLYSVCRCRSLYFFRSRILQFDRPVTLSHIGSGFFGGSRNFSENHETIFSGGSLRATWPKIPRSKLHGNVVSTSPPPLILNPEILNLKGHKISHGS